MQQGQIIGQHDARQQARRSEAAQRSKREAAEAAAARQRRAQVEARGAAMRRVMRGLGAGQVGRAALQLLEVVPGLTVWQLLMRDWEGRDVNQIGRQPPLSSNKAASHFPRLKQATGAPPGGRQAAHTRPPAPGHLDQALASLGHLPASLGSPRSAPPLSLRQPRPVGRRARAHAPHRGATQRGRRAYAPAPAPGASYRHMLQAPATGLLVCSAPHRCAVRPDALLRRLQLVSTREHERARE